MDSMESQPGCLPDSINNVEPQKSNGHNRNVSVDLLEFLKSGDGSYDYDYPLEPVVHVLQVVQPELYELGQFDQDVNQPAEGEHHKIQNIQCWVYFVTWTSCFSKMNNILPGLRFHGPPSRRIDSHGFISMDNRFPSTSMAFSWLFIYGKLIYLSRVIHGKSMEIHGTSTRVLRFTYLIDFLKASQIFKIT